MRRHTLEGNPPIEVTLRRSRQAKRLSLRVSRLDGRVTLTMPARASNREALAFLDTRQGWLRGHLDQLAPPRRVAVGTSLPFEGRDVTVAVGTGRRASIQAGQILVPEASTAGRRVKALLKTLARDRLAEASDHFARVAGCSYDRMSLRDTRSRWGSCSSKGVLMYSWRLIMAPPAVLRYVAAHEVAHLIEMNHSPAFWAVVARLDPGFETHRKWLRDNGDQLHQVQFDD